MSRYLKYLEIVNKIDSALEKVVSGSVDVKADLPKIKDMLEIQALALRISKDIDRMDDAVKSTAKLYAMGDQSAAGVFDGVMEQIKRVGEETARGRDFRSEREYPQVDGGYPYRGGVSQGWATEEVDRRASFLPPLPSLAYQERDRMGYFNTHGSHPTGRPVDHIGDTAHIKTPLTTVDTTERSAER